MSNYDAIICKPRGFIRSVFPFETVKIKRLPMRCLICKKRQSLNFGDSDVFCLW